MGNKRKPGTIVCDATVELNEDVSRYIFSSSLVVLWYKPIILPGLLEIQNKPIFRDTGMHQWNEPYNITFTG